MGEGWEYASTSLSQFHPTPKILDLIRRRKWVRKMVTSGSEGSAAIFNLESSMMVSQTNEFSSNAFIKIIYIRVLEEKCCLFPL